MKHLILFFVSFNLFTNIVFSQNIQWMSLKEARAAQKINPKKIFMDVYTSWCGPCKLLEKNTFQNRFLLS